MAVVNESSVQVTALDAEPSQRLNPIDHGGKLHFTRVTFVQGAVAGDATSVQTLARIPANATIVGHLGKLYFSAFGAARLLDVGTVANPDALASAVDVSSAGSLVRDESGTENDGLDNDTATQLDIISTVAGGTIPAAATIDGWIAWIAAR